MVINGEFIGDISVLTPDELASYGTTTAVIGEVRDALDMARRQQAAAEILHLVDDATRYAETADTVKAHLDDWIATRKLLYRAS